MNKLDKIVELIQSSIDYRLDLVDFIYHTDATIHLYSTRKAAPTGSFYAFDLLKKIAKEENLSVIFVNNKFCERIEILIC